MRSHREALKRSGHRGGDVVAERYRAEAIPSTGQGRDGEVFFDVLLVVCPAIEVTCEAGSGKQESLIGVRKLGVISSEDLMVAWVGLGLDWDAGHGVRRGLWLVDAFGCRGECDALGMLLGVCYPSE